MTIITDAVEKLRTLLEGSGCEDGIVTLKRNPGASRCQYERGVTIEAHFGGGHGQVVTDFPIQATTRISSMYGSPLASPQERSAALTIINAATGFLCIARKLHPCPAECYDFCLTELRTALKETSLACIGDSPTIAREFSSQMTTNPENADTILVIADGLISTEILLLVERLREKKRILLLGPSFAGLSALIDMEQWCPYGK